MAPPLPVPNVHHGYLHIGRCYSLLGAYLAKYAPQVLRSASVKNRIVTLAEDWLDPCSGNRTMNTWFKTPSTLHWFELSLQIQIPCIPKVSKTWTIVPCHEGKVICTVFARYKWNHYSWSQPLPCELDPAWNLAGC